MSVAGLPAAFSRERRRSEAISKGLNGIDFVDVADDRVTLSVFFFLAAPKETQHRHYRITGGTHVRDLKIVAVHHAGGDDPARADCLQIRVDRPGDHSTYRLEVVDLADFDPLFRSIAFTFGQVRGLALDCAAAPDAPPPAPAAEPELDYLAKDYDSFRQLILDRFALNVPSWTETHVPDIGMTLVEVLAYAADQLSYFQDAVATEAYLDTARLRISARRHARLMDYAIQEGCNARAWISIETATDIGPFAAADVSFATAGNGEIFEPVGSGPISALAAHSSIAFYTWGDTVRVLPAGATTATLRDAATGLNVGDVLLFEEMLGPATGSPLDADPAHRCAVRITSLRADVDPVYDTPVVEVAWSVEDRLPFALTLVTNGAEGTPGSAASVARGNVVLVDHGSTLASVEVIGIVPATGAFRPKLAQPNLTYRAVADLGGSAATAVAQDPRDATPQIVALTSTVIDRPPTAWTTRYDLLESGPDENVVAVEMDDERYANLRFGDGTLGAEPEPGAVFSARYRIGNGSAGNVGRETIVQMNVRAQTIDGAALCIRNPLAATGGTDPEPLAQIKLLAPQAASAELERAITPADYALVAERNPAVFAAAAVLRSRGLRPTVRVALDPLGTETVSASLIEAVRAQLEAVRSIGHDVEVVPATYVPLDLELQVWVLPGYLQGHVTAALLEVFSNRVLADGTLGLFHPNNLGFGQAVDESNLIAAAQAVTGVETVAIRRLARLFDESEGSVPPNGVLTLGPLEVAQLDNDPSAPERGRLRLRLGGGR